MPRFLLFAVLIVLFGGFVYFGLSKLKGEKQEGVKKVSTATTPTPTEFVFPTDTPTSKAASPTEEPTKTPSPIPTTDPIDKASGLNRANLSIEVQNGSGVVGAATKGSDILKGFGYKLVSVGNASSFDFENTTIQVKSDKSQFLPLLKKDLGFSYTIGSTSATLSASSSADAVVIVGKQ